ncbi:MAG: peptidylprolyl isomerase [Candidatus Aenigmatarchaeota archaeon]
MQMNDFIRITFTGRIKEGGQVFDTGEKVPVIVGAEYVIRGLDKVLHDMTVGEKRTVEIFPDGAFGERRADFVKTIPRAEFVKHGTEPKPGMVVNMDNLRGRIMSVSGGRVKVDFNHPLAGKILVYDVEIVSKIEQPEEKIRAIFEFYTKTPSDKLRLEIKGKEAELFIAPIIHPAYKKQMAGDMIRFAGMEKIKFSEVFEKEK